MWSFFLERESSRLPAAEFSWFTSKQNVPLPSILVPQDDGNILARVLPALLSLVVAGNSAYQDLIADPRYTRTSFLLWDTRSRSSIFFYLAVYSLVAFVICIFFPQILNQAGVKTEGLLMSNAWTQGLMIGVSLKSIMGISLWTVPNSGATKISIEAMVGRFVNFPRMLENIKENYHASLRAYVSGVVGKRSVAEVRENLKGVLTHLPEEDLQSFAIDLDKAVDKNSASRFFLERYGRRLFEEAFPK